MAAGCSHTETVWSCVKALRPCDSVAYIGIVSWPAADKPMLLLRLLMTLMALSKLLELLHDTAAKLACTSLKCKLLRLD